MSYYQMTLKAYFVDTIDCSKLL